MGNRDKKLPINRLTTFLLLLLLGMTAYAPALGAPFTVLDDYYSIVENPQIRSATGLLDVFSSSFFPERAYYRPLVAAVFLIDYRLFGLDPFYFHLTNLLLHVFNAFLVFLLVELLISRRMVALMSAGLFLLHPINSEAVNFIAGLSNLLSAFFCLSAFIFFSLACRKKTKGMSLYMVPSALSFVLALLSKESSVMLPVVMAGYVYLINRRSGKALLSFRTVLRTTAIFFLILIGYFIFRHQMELTAFWKPRSPQLVLLAFVSFLGGVVEYLRLLFVPVGLYFDRSHELYTSWSQLDLWITLMIIVLLVALVWGNRRRFGPESLFCILWAVAFLFPVSQLIMDIGVSPGQISIAEHFLYLPSFGIFALASLGLMKLSSRWFINRKIFTVALSGYGIFLFLMTISHSTLAKHPISAFKESIAHNPNNGRVLYCLGVELAHQKRFVEAEQYFRQSLQVDPSQAVAYIGLGKALSDQGRYWEALEEYEKVQDAGRFNAILWDNHAKLLNTILERFQQRLLTENDNARLHYSIGTVYFKMKNLSAARTAYEKALAIDSVLPEALYNLGVVSVMSGDQASAMGAFQKLLSSTSVDSSLSQSARGYLSALAGKNN